MRAMITGWRGQDGHYLFKHLASLEYETLLADVDVMNEGAVMELARLFKPDEIYNLAGVAHIYSDVNCTGAYNVLCAAEEVHAKFFQAGTYDRATPYGISKYAAQLLVAEARSRGVYAVTGILHNHESPLRSSQFVMGKVCRAAARGESVRLGNLYVKRDWSHAADVVRAMQLIMQQPSPKDWEIGSCHAHTVADICHVAYGPDWQSHVISDPALRRKESPWECSDINVQLLGWNPQYSFDSLIEEIKQHEIRAIAGGRTKEAA